MQHNLLKDSLVTAVGRRGAKKALSLPALFASMARREVTGFWALRAHQRSAWHMFLVQLAALALWKAGEDRLPEDGRTWTGLLRGLTRDFKQDEPWCLVVENSEQPAFLQPPDPGDLQWRAVPTPDSLDMLNSSKNFDVKHAVAYANVPEDWVYALVSLQTMAGYGGRHNRGIVRMSSELSSRPLLGLAPGSAPDMTVCASAWWARDVSRLLHSSRQAGAGTVGGPALLWCLPWPEGEQLRIPDLDPWFIEVCRRVRLESAKNRVTARRSGSTQPRTYAGTFRGNVGDPWMPVEEKGGKSLTLGKHGFTCVQLTELLFGGNWTRPFLAEFGTNDSEEMVLIAEAIARGNHQSQGFHTRCVPVPARALFESSAAAECAAEQIAEIKAFHTVLSNALVTIASGGDWRRIESSHYERTEDACGRFDRKADLLFFEALWKRVAAKVDGDEMSVQVARSTFLKELLRAAQNELASALSSVPCPSALRAGAVARAPRLFRIGVQKQFPELFEPEEPDDQRRS